VLLPGVSTSIHRSKIRGTLAQQGNRVVSATRLNPSVGVSLHVLRRLGELQIGLGVQSNAFLRSQRYLVQGAPVLDLPTVDLEVGTYVSLPIR